PPISEAIMRRRLAFSLLFALVLTWVHSPSRAAPPPAFLIIVHPSNALGAVDRRFLVDAFLKKTSSWPGGGGGIRPVDLGPKSPVRVRFSEDVLHRTVAEVKSYWQQRIFSGSDVPPPELDSDDEVVSYVLKHGGAVGYVSGTAKLNGARV